VLLLEPARVVAFERQTLASFEFEDPLGHVVEEVAVVGDRHDCAGVVAEETFEPVDRLGIEVVRRFVEEQQIGAAEQEAAERDPSAFAAGQHRHISVVRRATQCVHRDVDVALQRPRVGCGDLVFEDGLLLADLVVVGIGVGPLGHHLVVLVDDALYLGDAVHDVALDVLFGIELGLLCQVTDGEPCGQACFALVAVIEAGHDLEERRLAGAVAAEDPDLGAGVERQRDVLEDGLVRRVDPPELVGLIDEFVRHGGTEATGGTAGVRGSGPLAA